MGAHRYVPGAEAGAERTDSLSSHESLLQRIEDEQNMTAPTATRRSRFFQFSGIATISVFSVGILVLPAGTAGAEATAVGLGTAEPFAVLAGAGITNTGPTTLGGDIGTYPTPTITGVSDLTITGTNHGSDAVSQGAKPDVLTAYNTLAGQGPTQPTGADLTGRTLVSGVYNSGSSIALSGTVTLDAQGDPDAVFVFQAGSTLITSSSSTVALINGTQACNVFWQVGSSATLGTNSVFRGNLLALTDITATTEATVEGRLLAINGAVTLDTNTVTIPTCAPPVTTTTPTTTTTTVPPDTAITTTTTVVPPVVTTTTTVVPPEVTTTTTGTPVEATTTTPGPNGTTTTTAGVPPIITTSRNIPSIPEIPGLPTLPVIPPTVPGTVTVPSQVPTTSASRTGAPTTQPIVPESPNVRAPQVQQVPRGSVDTGDGSTQSQRSGQSGGAWTALLVATFGVVAISALVIRRTSR
ncbi:MAG: cytoskeleton protein RodZ [Rhodococcus erythropolis]|nr:cytoskeleton protein RodZ [Rhodococcus erythropolis]